MRGRQALEPDLISSKLAGMVFQLDPLQPCPRSLPWATPSGHYIWHTEQSWLACSVPQCTPRCCFLLPSSPSYPFTPEASPSQSGLAQALFYTTGTLPLPPLNWWNRGRSLFARDQPPPHALTLGSLQALLLMMLGDMCQQFSSIMENPFMDLSLIPIYLSREGNGETPRVQVEGRTNGVPLSTIAIAMKAQFSAILFYL